MPIIHVSIDWGFVVIIVGLSDDRGLPGSGRPADVLLPGLRPLFGRGLDEVYVDDTWVHVVPRFLLGLMGWGFAQEVPFGDVVAFLIFVDDFGVEPSLCGEKVLEHFEFPSVRDSSCNHTRRPRLLFRCAWSAEVVGSSVAEVQGEVISLCFVDAVEVVQILAGRNVFVTWKPLHRLSGRGLLDDVEEDSMSTTVFQELWKECLIKLDKADQELILAFVSSPLFGPFSSRQSGRGESFDVPCGDVCQFFLIAVSLVVMLSVFLWCCNAYCSTFNFGNICCFELGWCEWPWALCFVAERLEADVFNLECCGMLSFDDCTGVGIASRSHGFPCADQSDCLLVVVGSPVCTQRVEFVGRGDLHDVVLAVRLLFDHFDQLVVSGEPRWCGPLCCS